MSALLLLAAGALILLAIGSTLVLVGIFVIEREGK